MALADIPEVMIFGWIGAGVRQIAKCGMTNFAIHIIDRKRSL